MLPLWDFQSNVSLLYQFLSPFFSPTFSALHSEFSVRFQLSLATLAIPGCASLYLDNSCLQRTLLLVQYCNFRSLRWFPVLLQYFHTHVSEWLGISCSTSTSKTSSPLFFAFLGFFSGIILDRSNGFFRLYPTTLELKLYPKSSVGSGFSFVGWPSLKCTLHTREKFFGVQTFPFLISLLIFSVHPLLLHLL